MSWSKWQRGDTDTKHKAEAALGELLASHPDFVKDFGPLYQMDDDDRYWRWWEFAVFDGTRWHTFHLDDRYKLSLESGSLSEEDAESREQVTELILQEFKAAVARSLTTG